jgi:hypothetical protein
MREVSLSEAIEPHDRQRPPCSAMACMNPALPRRRTAARAALDESKRVQVPFCTWIWTTQGIGIEDPAARWVDWAGRDHRQSMQARACAPGEAVQWRAHLRRDDRWACGGASFRGQERCACGGLGAAWRIAWRRRATTAPAGRRRARAAVAPARPRRARHLRVRRPTSAAAGPARRCG